MTPQRAGITRRAATTALDGRAGAEEYTARHYIRLGPPQRVGAEIEWFAALPDGSRPPLALVAEVLGDHSPRSLAPASPALPLAAGGRGTVEPGGQVEVSSASAPSAGRLIDALAADAQQLRRLLAARRIRLVAGAADAARPPERLLRLPRYSAMEARFDGIGPFGRAMMCATAATQVCADAAADAADDGSRWAMLDAAGPALIAAFAASPELAGVPDGRWASQRMRTWLALDPARTGSVALADYPAWAVGAPLLCLPRDGDDWTAPPGATFADWADGALDHTVDRRPGPSDLDYHLTTLFPLVRASGYFEVRYLDGQPDGGWHVPIRAVAALTAEPDTVAAATDLSRPTAGRWRDAAHSGLADPELRRAAADLLELAHSVDPDPSLAHAARRTRAGRSPLEDRP
ncbi:ergothioneine biosynthesis glutamate--cysteine ligase EgtA [Tsukamurella soli]|uniref:Glutamate--cysteine ligase EgtA n=1 Tax=Tsukamurella soli TaxID=644556 RepID=A0ABP8J1P4_9ACTN